MPTYISILRGINVGGNKEIKMDLLAKLYASLGFKNVRTYIRSGNLIFEAPAAGEEKLAEKIKKKILGATGFDVEVVLRTKEELAKIIKSNPFPPGRAGAQTCVAFLASVPKEIPADLDSVKQKGEELVIKGKEIYLYYPGGYATTKLTTNYFERKLKVVMTTRNWNTVEKLMEMAGE